MSINRVVPVPVWMKITLKLAGVYNILWGAWIVLFPHHFFDLVGMVQPNYPGIWQSVGMIVGVYGLGYYIAAFDPVRHWPIILVGFLGKLFGPVGLVLYAWKGELPWVFGWVNVTNDLIWLVPFAIILYYSWKQESKA
ncbi:alkyl hydroperoxide reductase [Cytophagaceae bacterium DM2B3-1]|uniref:Alkyl hydroperoxide reductase n=1 Tax=Xanthocytophaga flava TaxID=3048013 RepID=A0ABT7CNU1_9BACT|nr:alkyl hydroperoxide reductase [Xanthocytophaga flavus]MDJ1495420.1 alkyl hydroperoxide reductase [Xanthocytophaga flavus]